MNSALPISVVIPTYNPHAARLRRTLDGLAAQTLPADRFEVVLVDNASQPPVTLPSIAGLTGLRVVQEPTSGLTPARLRGIAESRGGMLVFVDDDNVLARDYLANVVRHFTAEPNLGALGGQVIPEFEQPPAAWTAPFHGLLALRDHGAVSLRARWNQAADRSYPVFAPIGAGLAIRRSLAANYAEALARDSRRRALDRSGTRLVSGGDNDLVMHVLENEFSVGYEPSLSLTHLIPPSRLERRYLGALNRAIARSWVRVLALHDIRPWSPISPSTVRLRQWRAWWRARAWNGDAAWVKWQGLCGTFEGQADLAAMDRSATSTPPAAR